MTERDLMVSGFSRHCVRTCIHVTDSNVVMADPFSPKRNDKYNLGQKQNLRKLCLKYKLEAEAEPKKHWDLKRKKTCCTFSFIQI